MLPFLANSITAGMTFLPGMSAFTPVFGLPLTIVAAVIERPFYTALGVGRNALWHSVRANVLSLLFGFVAMIVALGLTSVGGACVWPVGAVFASTWIERAYLRTRTRSALGFGRVLLPNIVSAAACVGVYIPVTAFDAPEYRGRVQPYETELEWALGVVCVVVVLAALLVPYFRPDRSGTVPAATPPAE